MTLAHSAATALQETLLFDALEWRSKVEFRPATPRQPAICSFENTPISLLCSFFSYICIVATATDI